MPYMHGGRRRPIVRRDALGDFWSFMSAPRMATPTEPTRAEGELDPAVAKWQAEVRARGNVPTRMPKGPNVGKLAEKYVDRSGTYRYALASPAALAADGRGAAVLASAIEAGKRVEDVEKTVALAKQGARDVLNLPREAVGAVLGIPPWLVTALVIAGGVVAFRTLVPSLPSRVARRNPPRRRRAHRRGRR